jgi:hypothetical protein
MVEGIVTHHTAQRAYGSVLIRKTRGEVARTGLHILALINARTVE